MMEENNNKGKGFGIFYAVVGVATLVVAIVGATFAYFSATAPTNTNVKGDAASAEILLTVDPVSTKATGKLVPQLTSTIDKAAIGTGGSSCVDAAGNTVCQVYKITITNKGSTAVDVNATMELTAATMDNLKWGIGTDATTFTGTKTYEKGETNLLPDTDGHILLGTDSSKTKEIFIIVYINETNAVQDDSGSFTSAINVHAVGQGGGLTSTFTGQAS